jgi:hypothetical protein
MDYFISVPKCLSLSSSFFVLKNDKYLGTDEVFHFIISKNSMLSKIF